MIYRTHTPAPPLNGFVDLFWYCEDYQVPHRRERVLPDGCIQIIIDLHNDGIPTFTGPDRSVRTLLAPAIVAGASSEYTVIDTSTLISLVGVQFKPGCAAPFLGVNAGETHNIDLPLDDVWSRGVSTLRERLIEEPTAERKFRVLEQALLEHAPRELVPNAALNFALTQFHSVPHTRSVAEVAAELGLSPKRLIQMFRDKVGLTPKLYCRIRRFQDALRQAGKGRDVSWAQVAAGAGYFDQAHFVRDFQSFSGINPTTYLLHRGEWTNHVPLSD